MNTLDVSRWLWDFYLSATLLVAGVLLTGVFVSQPARRIALAWATVGGLVVLMLLTMIPNWSRIALLPPAPPAAAPPHYLQPLLGDVVQRDMGSPPPIPVGSPIPPPPLRADPAKQTIVIDWGTLSLYILLTGSLAVLGWLSVGAWQVRRLRGRAEAALPGVTDLLDDLAPKHRVQLGMLAELPVPVALGLRSPCILLPRTLATSASREQLRSVLSHELAHIEHRDLWLLALLRGLTIALWPHPLFWLLRRQVRRDQEVLADTAAAELSSRGQYAEQLVAIARSAAGVRVPRLASSVGLWEQRSQLTERVKLLLDEKLSILRNCSRGWRLGSAGMLAALALGLSLVTLSPAENQVTSESRHPGQGQTQLVEEAVNSFENLQARVAIDEIVKSRHPNTIYGACIDENSLPLAGVQVEVFAARSGDPGFSRLIHVTQTDSDGKFRVDNVIDVAREFPDGYPDGDLLPPDVLRTVIVARAPSRVPGVENAMAFHVARDGIVEVFEMMKGQTLSGRVVNDRGEPVAGARVSTGRHADTVGVPGDINASVTAANGEFAITDLAPYDVEAERRVYEDKVLLSIVGGDDPWERSVTVKHRNYATKREKYTDVPGTVNVTLSPESVLSGRILSREERSKPQPIKGAEVTVLRDSDAFETASARTDSEGFYRIESLPNGKYTIIPKADGWVGMGLEAVEVPVGQKVDAPDILLTRGAEVQIQLVDDATGKPLGFSGQRHAYVVAHSIPRSPAGVFSQGHIEFSREGIGRMHVPPGNYAFMVQMAPDEDGTSWNAAEFMWIRSQEDFNRMTAFQTREGEAIDIEVRMVPERPAASDDAVFAPVAEPATAPAESDIQDESDDHTYQLPAVKEKAPGQPDQIKAEPERQPYAELRKLAKPNTILGLCVDENNEPLEGVDIELYIRPLRAKAGELRKLRATPSNADGKFSFENVVDISKEFPDGFEKLDLNFPSENTRIFEVVGRKEGRVTRFSNDMASRVAQFGSAFIMQMPPSQTLRGRIIDEQGRPIPNAEIAFGPVPAAIAQPNFTTKSADDGEFVLNSLERYDASEARSTYEREHGMPRTDPRFPNWLPWERLLTISHPKFATKRVSIGNVPGRMEIPLEVGSILTGRILKQEHGESPGPAGYVDLYVTYATSDQSTGESPRPATLHITADPDGLYRTEAIEAGPVTVTASAAGWFGKPVQLTAEDDNINHAPDLILTRGGRMRIHLIDDETGSPLEFPAPTKAFVAPQPLPDSEISTVVEFSSEGIGEQQLPAGKYHFLVSVPETERQTELKDKLFSTIRDVDKLDQYPSDVVVEGEVRDVEVRMVRQRTGTRAEVADALLLPARQTDNDAYENGIFVPDGKANVAR